MAIEMLRQVEGFGDVSDRLIANNFDPGILRPWWEVVRGEKRNYITKMVVNDHGELVPKVFQVNAPATLSRDAWYQFDNVIVRAVRERLRAFGDIRSRGLVYNLPNGMAHTVLQYQTVGDITPATVSMDPVRRSEGDRPTTDTANLPLPVVHKDFDFSAREIMVSRQGNLPLDTTTAELAARKVAEEIEKMTIGNVGAPFTYGGGYVYGFINHPDRAVKADMTVPTGANGTTVISDVLTLRQLLIDARHFGPYVMYVNSQWSTVLDTDFSSSKGDMTLRQRILAIEGISDVRTLDHLPTTGWHVLLVEMTSETVRAVVGMEPQLVQWESMGGLMKHYKVMAIQVPQVRPDTAGNAGIAHGRAA